MQLWSELLAPLVNMIKDPSDLFFFSFFFFFTKIQPFIEVNKLRVGESEINDFFSKTCCTL